MASLIFEISIMIWLTFIITLMIYMIVDGYKENKMLDKALNKFKKNNKG